LPKGLEIIHEDRDILVINKPAGLLTIATDSEKSKTAYAALTDYVKKGSIRSPHRIFIVHRLDRDTSGILIFAKTEIAKTKLQSSWEETSKTYVAVTYGSWKIKEGKIESYLAENKAQSVFSTKDQGLGKFSQTEYKVIKETEKYSLLNVNLLTGRKHQIRVHFAEANHPIVGDARYGETSRKFPRMALHAKSIKFNHPFSGKEMFFETTIPPFLSGLVGGL